MRNLLAAGFSRIMKDRVFWLVIAFMAGLGLFVPIRNFLDFRETGFHVPLDNYFFGFAMFTGFVAAVFGSLFIGTEYSDGTLRNKVQMGHTRNALYFSNWVLTTAVALLANLAFIVAVCAAGIPLFGPLETGGTQLVLVLLVSVLMTMAFTSIFTCLGMLVSNKTIVAIISILGVIALFMCALSLDQALNEPEFEKPLMITADGVDISEEKPNPDYLQPDKRAVYELFYDLLPTGQGERIASRKVTQPGQMLLCSLLIIVVSSAGGVFFFRRKDLK